MTARPSIDPAEAVEFVSFMASWGAGYVPVFLDGAPAPRAWLPMCGDGPADLAKRAKRWDFVGSAQVEIGLPHERPNDGGGVGAASMLWVWLENKDQVWRASRHQRSPTVVLRMGASVRRLALWMLDERVPHASVVAANRKLAYALRAPQKWAEPERLRIPLPGTFLRVSRARPVPVLVTKMDVDTYSRAAVVKGLRDPPDKNAWRNK